MFCFFLEAKLRVAVLASINGVILMLEKHHTRDFIKKRNVTAATILQRHVGMYISSYMKIQ